MDGQRRPPGRAGRRARSRRRPGHPGRGPAQPPRGGPGRVHGQRGPGRGQRPAQRGRVGPGGAHRRPRLDRGAARRAGTRRWPSRWSGYRMVWPGRRRPGRPGTTWSSRRGPCAPATVDSHSTCPAPARSRCWPRSPTPACPRWRPTAAGPGRRRSTGPPGRADRRHPDRTASPWPRRGCRTTSAGTSICVDVLQRSDLPGSTDPSLVELTAPGTHAGRCAAVAAAVERRSAAAGRGPARRRPGRRSGSPRPPALRRDRADRPVGSGRPAHAGRVRPTRPARQRPAGPGLARRRRVLRAAQRHLATAGWLARASPARP